MRSPHFQRLISAIIVAGVLLAVVGTATAHEDHSTDEWPTTCVDLNDIVEEHLGNPHIVGIYQNTFGDQAEAACQTDHRNDVIAVFGWAIATESGASGSDLELDWPTTCVQLNDIVEGHLGNQGNVAIYRNTFGDQAEVACQNDHRDDVRSVFAWAIGGGAPLVTGVLPFPAATPTPTPIPGRSDLYRPVMPPEHMVYVWWKWSSDEGEFESLDIDFTIHNDIVGFSGPHGLYLMLGSAQISGAPFYFGLQTDVYDPASGYRGKSLIFSRWGTRYLDHARVADPVEGWTQSSGHEGDFIGVRRSYQWGAGVYRVRIAPDGSDASGRWFGMWITDRSTGETVWGGSLRFPYENGKAANQITSIHDDGDLRRHTDKAHRHTRMACEHSQAVGRQRQIYARCYGIPGVFEPHSQLRRPVRPHSGSAPPPRRRPHPALNPPAGNPFRLKLLLQADLQPHPPPVHLLQRPVSPAVLVLGATGQA